MTQQYDRQVSLIVANAAGQGLELAALHVQFQVNHWIMETPNTLTARVYNLSAQTMQLINKEFTQVVLQAGYVGNYGQIFRGTIKQLRRGRESATDTYLDIFGADADISHNWAVVNRSLAAGHTPEQVRQVCVQSFNDQYPTTADAQVQGLTNTPSPRGACYFGMCRDTMSDLAKTQDMHWNLNNSNLTMLPQSAFAPGEQVIINSATGMLGIPQQTQDGITVTTLLNPNIGMGQRVQIDNASIAQYLKANVTTGLNYNTTTLPVSTASDGIYRVLFVDHVGDTRGNEWETRLTCDAIDGTVHPHTQASLNTTAFASPTPATTTTMTDDQGNTLTDDSGNIMKTAN